MRHSWIAFSEVFSRRGCPLVLWREDGRRNGVFMRAKSKLFIMTQAQLCQAGGVAQTVERSLCMREVRGSIPRISTVFTFSFS